MKRARYAVRLLAYACCGLAFVLAWWLVLILVLA